MKVLMAPVNITGQPLILVEGLRKQGVDAHLLQYTMDGTHPLGYRTDRVVLLAGKAGNVRAAAQMETLKSCLQEGFEIFHFWQRTLFSVGAPYENFMGLDLPFIKHRGRKIVYRFTGHDLRWPSKYIKVTPYNAYRYGYQSKFDEEMQKRYLDYLQEYVDQFVVQDSEMQGYLPKATIIPRAINLQEWPEVGVERTDCPLVIHAPTDPAFKGTALLLAAIEDLKAEGLQFDFKHISKMQHSEASTWYKKADIIVDQLHMGWYGILALEGMALGKPVMVYIREDLAEQYPTIPVENTNPDNVKDKLRALIKDYDRRAALGQRARQYVEEIHSVDKVVPQLVALYNKVSSDAPVAPSGFADCDYFLSQYEQMSLKISQLRYKATMYERLIERNVLFRVLVAVRRLLVGGFKYVHRRLIASRKR